MNIVKDYDPDTDILEMDPFAPDIIEQSFTNKIARMIIHAQEALQLDSAEVNTDEFYSRRGDFLDLADDPDIQDWLFGLQKQNRVPFRRHPVSDD